MKYFPSISIPALLAVVGLTTQGAKAQQASEARPGPSPADQAFFSNNCLECHDADSKRGGLDLTSLGFDLNDAATFASWVKVYDKVQSGEMPPKDEPKPSAAHGTAFQKDLFTRLVQVDRARWTPEGRSLRRRMNRYEYEDTLRDVLALPHLQVKAFLPEDGEAHRFNKVGEALDVSHVNLARYLNAADHALRAAMVRQIERPETKREKFHARDQRGFRGGFFQGPELRQTFPLLGWKGQPELMAKDAVLTVGPGNPALRDQEAVAIATSTYEPTEIRFSSFKAPHPGFYTLRFSTYSIWVGNKSEKKYWEPDQKKVSRGRRSEPVTVYSDSPPHDLRRLGGFDAKPVPGVSEMRVWLNAGETIRPDAARLVRPRPPDFRNPLAQKDGMPAVAFRWLEVQGPLLPQWPPLSHVRLFGDLPLANVAGSPDKIEVISSAPEADARRLLAAFLLRMYRRPVTEPETQRFLGVFGKARGSGYSFTESMIATYTAVLSSPAFLFFDDKPGQLDDLALAARLSYFLTNSAPDDELRSIAAAGKLGRPRVLRAQTERLLQDERAGRFVNDFLDYWLDLRRMASTAPDATLYPDYQLDDFLVESMTAETQAFFAELVRRDLGVANVVSARFAMLNERLASHYGVDGVQGVALRRVRLSPNSVRGGLLTQGSVLKVTSNGTTTSPVVRGAWIMERILGKRPPPPPADVPAVEPDTSGATTIREQLEKHRSNGTCNGCHKYIDPAGFALESFDPMGAWRDTYRALGKAEKVQGFGHDGLLYAFSHGPKPDPTGELADGRRFDDIRQLKRLLLSDEEQLARNMVHQLCTYATGAGVQFSDRVAVNQILAKSRGRAYGVRTLIHELVQSDLFRNK